MTMAAQSARPEVADVAFGRPSQILFHPFLKGDRLGVAIRRALVGPTSSLCGYWVGRPATLQCIL